MGTITLEHVERLVDQLTPLDQVRLLEYLAPRIARAVEDAQAVERVAEPQAERAWAELFRVGDRLADTDRPEGDTLTATVFAMRR